MEALKPTFTVTSDKARAEAHFACSGLWTMETMVEFQRALIEATKPMFLKGVKMRSLADLRGFVPQTREVAEAIEIVVREAIKLGTTHTAIVTDTKLTAIQYRRLNTGLELKVFDNVADARTWLRTA